LAGGDRTGWLGRQDSKLCIPSVCCQRCASRPGGPSRARSLPRPHVRKTVRHHLEMQRFESCRPSHAGRRVRQMLYRSAPRASNSPLATSVAGQPLSASVPSNGRIDGAIADSCSAINGVNQLDLTSDWIAGRSSGRAMFDLHLA
jgi:hypothetical protein